MGPGSHLLDGSLVSGFGSNQKSQFLGSIFQISFVVSVFYYERVFSCEFCEIFKNTFFTDHLRVPASAQLVFCFFFYRFLWKSHCVTHKKLDWLVFTFLVNCRFFSNNSSRIGPINLKIGVLCHMNKHSVI